MRAIALALALLFSLAGCVLQPQTSGSIPVHWTNPVAYDDASTLPVTDITQTRVEYGSCNGTAFGTKLGEVIAIGGKTGTTIPNLDVGDYCVRAYTTASNAESNASAVAQGSVSPTPPELSVNETTAYTIIKSEDQFIALPVGTVPIGTRCDPFQPILDFYVVPVAEVTFTGSARPIAVVASCQ